MGDNSQLSQTPGNLQQPLTWSIPSFKILPTGAFPHIFDTQLRPTGKSDSPDPVCHGCSPQLPPVTLQTLYLGLSMTGQEQPPQGCPGDDFPKATFFFVDRLLLFISLLAVNEQKQDLHGALSQMLCGRITLLLVHA